MSWFRYSKCLLQMFWVCKKSSLQENRFSLFFCDNVKVCYSRRSLTKFFKLVPRPNSCSWYTRHFSRLHDTAFTIPRCYKDVYTNSFLPLMVFSYLSICFMQINIFPSPYLKVLEQLCMIWIPLLKPATELKLKKFWRWMVINLFWSLY